MCRHHNEGDAEYTHWESGEPNDHCSHVPPCNCAYFYSSSMEWRDECCETSLVMSVLL